MRTKERVAPNLYVVTRDNGKKFYVVRFMLNGKALERSLGAVEKLSLRSARAKAGAIMAEPEQPPEPRKKALTFLECAEEAFRNLQTVGRWKRQEYAIAWWNRLALYAIPALGSMPVDEIARDDVLSVLRPIWTEKPAMAKRVRACMGAVFDWCILQDFRKTNPAQWRSNLSFFLPNPTNFHQVKHHNAPSIEELQNAVAWLIKSPLPVSGLILFIIATVSRMGEVRQATDDQIIDEVWTVPEDAQKVATEPRKVPLNELAIIALTKGRPNQIFRYSPKYCRLVLKDAVGRDDVTIHGIRSTFRDWCAATGADFETAERCLSHQTTTQVQRAYLRRDYFDERKALLQKWADVLLTNVKD